MPLRRAGARRGCGRASKPIGLMANRSFEPIGANWFNNSVPYLDVSFKVLILGFLFLLTVFAASYGGCEAGRQCDAVPTVAPTLKSCSIDNYNGHFIMDYQKVGGSEVDYAELPGATKFKYDAAKLASNTSTPTTAPNSLTDSDRQILTSAALLCGMACHETPSCHAWELCALTPNPARSASGCGSGCYLINNSSITKADISSTSGPSSFAGLKSSSSLCF